LAGPAPTSGRERGPADVGSACVYGLAGTSWPECARRAQALGYLEAV